MTTTPNRTVFRTTNSPILEQRLKINEYNHKRRNSLKWGSLNLVLLSVLLYDVCYYCPLQVSYYDYLEYSFILLFLINFVYHFCRVVRGVRCTPLEITREQKSLLGVKDSDSSFTIVDSKPPTQLSTPLGTPDRSFATTPINLTALSWRTNLTPQNESLNYSMPSPSWIYHKGTPDMNLSYRSHSPQSPSAITPPRESTFRDTSSIEFISDADDLKKYLAEHEESERINKVSKKTERSSNILSSFWSHPVAKTAKDMTSYLSNCRYQLSTQSPIKSASTSPGGKHEDSSLVSQAASQEVWSRINVDNVALTKWNENLRMWISQTILERLVQEFGRINESLERHGLNDIKIGMVGLERLRKTAQMVPIMQSIPSLTTLIPFLEVTPNQEYLEKRIRELSKGGCMSEFKWNSGGSYNGKEWDDSLPTDCDVVMHLLAAYLDTQLVPLPNMPDTKAFSGHHYIKTTDKLPNLTPKSLAIQQVSEKPPHYRVIVKEKVYDLPKGHNNLFHTILFFLHHVNTVEHGMLGRVNLGRAGVNMLWIIE